MANVKPILYGAGAFALVYGAGLLYRQVSLIKNSEYNMKDIKFNGIDIRGIHLTANLEMKNNSDMAIEAYKQTFNIYVNNIFVGVITDNKPALIPAKGAGEFGFNIDIGTKQAIDAGLNVLAGGKSGISNTIVRIKGTMQVKTSGILFSRLPLDLSFRIGDYLK